MFITLDQNENMIALIFYDVTNFYEIERLTIHRNHFDCAMVVHQSELEDEEKGKNFIIALFTEGAN